MRQYWAWLFSQTLHQLICSPPLCFVMTARHLRRSEPRSDVGEQAGVCERHHCVQSLCSLEGHYQGRCGCEFSPSLLIRRLELSSSMSSIPLHSLLVILSRSRKPTSFLLHADLSFLSSLFYQSITSNVCIYIAYLYSACACAWACIC